MLFEVYTHYFAFHLHDTAICVILPVSENLLSVMNLNHSGAGSIAESTVKHGLASTKLSGNVAG